MNVWAVANQKGGVGKTTTVVSLAGELIARGQRCLLVDLDPHASLTQYFNLDVELAGGGVYALFVDEEREGVKPLPTSVERLSILPASAPLATLERQAGQREGLGLVLAKALERWRDAYDYVLLDCPPLLGILMVNALAACERLVIPTQTEFLALRGLDSMLRTLTMIEKAQGRKLNYLVVPTLFDRRTRAGHDALRDMERRYNGAVWDETIPLDTQFREASRRGLPLNRMLPEARGAIAYRRLLDRLLTPTAGGV